MFAGAAGHNAARAAPIDSAEVAHHVLALFGIEAEASGRLQRQPVPITRSAACFRTCRRLHACTQGANPSTAC